MVRLKASTASGTVTAGVFQFHYGTIKRSLRSLQANRLLFYFNSTMVRLKEAHVQKGHAFQEFQFHYGTIKSQSSGADYLHNNISIPLWYD